MWLKARNFLLQVHSSILSVTCSHHGNQTVRQKNKFLGLLLLTIGIGIGIGITSSFPQLAGLNLLKSQSKPAAESGINQTEMKKKALQSFYQVFTEAENNEDWGNFIAQSIRMTKNGYL
jgi:hypothetical protein